MSARVIIGIIFILLGISAFTGINLGRFIGPLFLIFIGWLILTRPGRRMHHGDYRAATQNGLNEVLIFSGAERRIVSSDFIGGKIVAVFGGADFDLTKVQVKQKVIDMELVAVFGGVRLRVPEDWQVSSTAVGVIGGVDNRALSPKKSVELRVRGAAVFGEIEIYN